MKIKKLIVAIMVSVLVFSVIPANYVMASETGENGRIEIHIDGEDVDVDEPEIEIPATENEYLISDSCEGISENGPILYSVTQNVQFWRATERKVKFAVKVIGSSSATKLTSKVYLQKKTGAKTYKYIGKKSIKNYAGKNMVHEGSFSVEKGSKSYTKAPVFVIEK